MSRGIDRAITLAHRLDDSDAETLPGAGILQHFGRAAAAVAEGAIVADHDMAEADRPDHHLPDERFSAPAGEGGVEMLDEQELDAELGDLAFFDPERGQSERFAPGHEDGARMRLEGQDAGRYAGLPRPLAGILDQRRVP